MAIEIKQRKVCGNCRAFSRSSDSCGIGYATKQGKVLLGVVVSCIPLEPCPKPLTVSDSVEAIMNYKK